MRPQSAVQIDIKGRKIGGPAPLVCLPLMATNLSELAEQSRAAVQLGPDMIEWRVDAFEAVGDLAAVKTALNAVYRESRSLPLLFTCRDASEGGKQVIAPGQRGRLYELAVASGKVDLVDIELSSGTDMIAELVARCRSKGVKLVLSYHNFEETPDHDTLLQKLREAENAGGDIAKVAVMPREERDVLTLLMVACEARRQHLKIPLVAISMGSLGAISRIAGGLFGSDITFASGIKASAPGQLPLDDLKKAWKALPRHF